MIDSAKNLRQVPTLPCDSEEDFQAIWAARLPLVVNGLEKKLQGAWDPIHFTEAHGGLSATMLQATWTPTGNDQTSEGDGVEVIEETTVTVGRFFELFTKDNRERGTIVKMKVCFVLVKGDRSLTPSCISGLPSICCFQRPPPTRTR
jgi:hypothetical protein